MTSQGPPPPSSSSLPSAMGPGARPIQQGESPGGGIAEIMQIRNKYLVQVESETLQLGYELKGIPRTYRLAFESIPIGTFKRKWLFGGPRRAQISGITVIDFIRGTENLAGRPLTQTEAEAMAFYSTNRTIYSLWGNLTGCVAGGLIAWRTYDKMKFPFRSPRPMEEYQSFPTKHWAMVTGRQAQFMWQFTRFNVWAALAVFAASPLFAAAGDTFGMYGLYKDERTKGLMMEVKGTLDRVAANRYRGGPDQRQGQNSPPTTQTQTQDGPQYGNQDYSQDYYQRDSSRNDYSGGDQNTGDNSFTDGTTDTGVMGDSSMRAARESRQSTSSTGWDHRSGAPQYTQPNSNGPRSSSGSTSFFDDDDASPTAGNDPDMSTPGSGSGGGFPGSWARIRRENQRSGSSDAQGQSSPNPNQGFQGQQRQQYQQQQQHQQQPASPSNWNRDTSSRTEDTFSQRSSEQRNDRGAGGDSFSFSDTEADRQLAREQAQKEFDAMLDKERRASGSDEYDRGMRAVQSGEEGAVNSGVSAWERRRRG